MTAAELKRLRSRMKWTQADAARSLGCSTRSIATWEKSGAKIPPSIALAASAALLNLPPYGSK